MNTKYSFLQGGGKMGELIRAKDWSKTPLGEPKTWPLSLRSLIPVVLENPFGMYIAWGKEYTQIYNEACGPILGTTKHPKALGLSTRETFSEVWHIIDGMFEKVMKGEAIAHRDFKLQLDRNGYLETCYFDLAYSPIKQESGEVGGVLVTVIETTNKRKAEEEHNESKNELEFVIESAQLGIFDYNPLTNKFTANSRLKSWFGLPSEEQIELPDAINSISDREREKITSAIQKALEYSSGGFYNEKFSVINPFSKKETIVHAKGKAWFNEDKVAYRLNGTLEDVTEQILARRKKMETEQHLRTMVLESPVGICVIDAETLVSEIANESFIDIAGKPHDAIVGKFYWDTFAEVRAEYETALDTVIETGKPFNANEEEVILIRHGREESIYLTFVYSPLKDENGKVIKVAVWVLENTMQVEDRKKIMVSENNLRLMILQAPMAISIFRGDEYKVEIANKYALELWGRTEEQVLNISIFDSMPELKTQGIKEMLDGVSKTGKRFATSEQPIKLKRKGQLETIYINFSYEAIYDGDGEINGIMAIGFDVTQQVVARKNVEESEHSIRTLVENAPFPIGVYEGEEMRISLANQSIMDAWGKGNDVIGKLYSEVLPELENQKIYEQIRGVLKTGVTFQAVNERVDLIKDGTLKPYYFNYNFTPLFNTAGEVYAVMNTAADVTELNEAQQKIEESEKRFRDSVRQAPLGIVILRGPDNITEMANESYLQIVDKTKEEFVGKPLFETLPEVKETIAPIIANIYKTGNAFYGNEFPIKLKRHGGTVTAYFNFVYQPLKENNVITGLMVVATEVTATVTAKNLIAENEEKLKIIIDASELGVWDYNIKTEESTLSERCHEILGFPGEHDLPHTKLVANLHPDDLDIREKAFQKAFTSGFLHYEIRVIWKDKSVHWMETKGKVFYDAKNEPERILGTIRDVTEERNFQQELLEREEKFRLLADSMPQHIWTSDREGNLNYFNQSVFDFSGLTLEQIDKDGWIQIVHPDDRDENIKQWTNAIKTGNDFLCEHRFRKHNGEYRWQLSRATPQKDNNGIIKMWVGSSTDIQEQKVFTTELERQVKERTNELNQKNIDLESINKELQSFVYISSHDLQEPLRKIQTFSSRILDSEYETLSDNAKKYFARMQQSANRMQNLIQDLFAYSRTSVQERKFEVVNLLEIIEDIQETLKEELEQHNVSFELVNLCKVKVITFQFKQLIINLISNSIKFARVEEPMHIKISCAVALGAKFEIEQLLDETEYCHISIADNGIGFEQQYNERIFEVFQRLHGKDKYDGTGIGLAIVKKIVDNHHGTITAKG